MMSIRIKGTLASLGVAALLLPVAAGAGGDGKKFSRADFERCNQQAMQIAGVASDSPAALPGSTQSSQPGSQHGTSGSGTSSPGVSSGTGTSGSGMGTSGSGVSSGTGTTGSSITSGAGTMGADQELDRVVDAYRSCLQQAKQSN